MSESENLEVQRARDRTNEQSDRNTDTTMGITDRRLFDVAKNLNESARSGFLVGTATRTTSSTTTTRPVGAGAAKKTSTSRIADSGRF